MKTVPAIVVVILSMACMATRSGADEPTHFAITMNDKLIGYATSQSQQIKKNGREFQQLRSETFLKVALLGKERRTLLTSETLLQPGTMTPAYYKQTSAVNDVVRITECEFTSEHVRTWSYRKDEAKGEPTETALPENTYVLGGNNFAHWRLLMLGVAAGPKGEAAKVSIFLPDGAKVETFEFTRLGIRTLQVGGESRSCTVWQLKNAGMDLLVDARTNELVRMDLPAQQTKITITNQGVIKLAQKAVAEELLARHFAKSNVGFDDYLKVRSLKAEIDVSVIGSGIENDASVLTTAMQKFDGKKNGPRITGTVVVHSRPYDGKDAPAFPTNEQSRAKNSRWLTTAAYIESDDRAIVEKSAELTRGATTTWEATLLISRWVQKSIRYTIADTPSARLALEKREGDCGPHSTLSVAMLRAAGIPAKLVGGLLYTPTFGGSFGQHAWVEVFMGKAGWVTVDPTTGEYDRCSATHIKLFEGMGGVVPKSVKVVAFQPANREIPATKPAAAKPLPWKIGKDYTFKYVQGTQELGTETFRIKKVKHADQAAIEMTSELRLKAGAADVKGTTRMIVTPNALPLTFRRDHDVAGKKTTVECRFNKGTVDVKISGSVNLTQQVKMQPGDYCFDNSLMASFALICSQLNLEVGKSVEIRTFHPSSLQVIPLTLKVKQMQQVMIGKKKLECFECEVSPIKNTFWIARNGMFVKAKQGSLVIELQPAERE